MGWKLFARRIGWVTDAYLHDNRSEAMLAHVSQRELRTFKPCIEY